MADLGKAYVQVVPSAEGIEGSITDLFEPGAKVAGQTSGASLGKELGSIATKTIAALGVGKAISDSIGNGMNFETSMTKASTLFSGTAEEFSELQDQIMAISSSTGVAASQLAEAAYSAESASVPMGNLGNMIEASAQLATAGFTDIDTALSATAKTMNAYGMMSDDVTATQEAMEKVQRVLIQTQNKGITTVDELGASLSQVTPTAAAFNVSFEQVGAALAGMTASGTATAQATTQLNSLIAELGKEGTTAADNLAEAAEGTEYAGMSFADMMANGADLNDVLTMMQGLADKNNLSMVDMFSSIEAGKAALSISGSDFTGNLEAMATEADVVGEAYSTMSDTVQFKADQFKNSLKNMGIEAFNSMAPILTGLVEGIQKVFQELAPVAEKLGSAVKELGSKFIDAAGNLLGLDEGFSATDVIVEALTVIIEGLTEGIGFLTEHMDIILPIIIGVVGAFTAMQVISTITGIVTGLTTAFSLFLSPIGLVVAAIGAAIAIGVALYKNWDVVKQKAEEIWTNVKTAIMTPINTVKTWLSTTFNNILNTATTIWENLKTAITSPIESAKEIISGIIEKIKGFFSFTFEWPHIPMPHFGITPEGWKVGDLLKGSIPKLGIEWYAKGGVFDSASVIGVGEAGREAVVPLQGEYMRPFAKAIADELSGGGTTVIVNNHFDGTENGEEVANTIVRQIQMELRMA